MLKICSQITGDDIGQVHLEHALVWFYNHHQAAVNMRSQLTNAAHEEIAERIVECNHMTRVMLIGTYF